MEGLKDAAVAVLIADIPAAGSPNQPLASLQNLSQSWAAYKESCSIRASQGKAKSPIFCMSWLWNAKFPNVDKAPLQERSLLHRPLLKTTNLKKERGGLVTRLFPVYPKLLDFCQFCPLLLEGRAAVRLPIYN